MNFDLMYVLNMWILALLVTWYAAILIKDFIVPKSNVEIIFVGFPLLSITCPRYFAVSTGYICFDVYGSLLVLIYSHFFKFNSRFRFFISLCVLSKAFYNSSLVLARIIMSSTNACIFIFGRAA